MQITKQPRKATATAAATVSASETVFDLETFLLDFVVEVATGGLLSPVFEVKVGATLFLRISCDVGGDFDIPSLRDDPLLDELLGIGTKLQHELALVLQLVNRFHSLVNFRVERRDFLLTRGGEKKIIHLSFERVVSLDVDIVTRGLLVVLSVDGDEVVDDDRVGGMKKRMKSLRNIREFHFEAIEDLHQVPIAVDQLPLMRVLQFVVFDVVPKGGYDGRSGGSVNTEEAGETTVQFKLHRLVIQKQQQSALDIFITRSLYLKAVGLLRGVVAMPLDQMIVRSVQVLVQFDHQRFEEGRELPLGNFASRRSCRALILDVVQQSTLHPQLPGRDGSVFFALLTRFGGKEGVGNENPEFPFDLLRSF